MLDSVSREVLTGLEARFPGAWDVCPGNIAALDDPIVHSYSSLSSIKETLVSAGFSADPDYVSTEAIADTHDMATMLKFRRGTSGPRVIVARRLAS